MPTFPFDNSYARLPADFFARIDPTPVATPRLIKLNIELARELGIDATALTGENGAAIFAGSKIPDGAEPIALAYAGHQFGGFVPQLGDGRAVLLGEVVDRSGRRRDIQLKGSGPTPFSRRGDGRAALGPALREYIVSEAMAALGIPTTRALAVAMTGESVFREIELPGAVVTRVASSHIRIGTFQYFAARGDEASIRALADHAIARHYPQALTSAAPYQTFLEGVIARQADLVAQWLLVGFVHGVMNTDNVSIAGETIDYGPCAFLDAYDPVAVFSSIDRTGRYAYANQPGIAQWNLVRLAECLLPLLSEDQEAAVALAQQSLALFAGRFNSTYLAGLRAKLGLATERPGDLQLGEDFLRRMAEGGADFSLTFRRLGAAAADPAADTAVGELFANPASFEAWATVWRTRLAEEPMSGPDRKTRMDLANPAIIARNHRVEAAIEAAVGDEDFAPFEELVDALSRPYEDRAQFAAYGDLPPADHGVYRTFCGT